MKNPANKLKKFAPSKENATKLLAAIGAVGLGATLYLKRNKVKEVFNKVREKFKKSA